MKLRGARLESLELSRARAVLSDVLDWIEGGELSPDLKASLTALGIGGGGERAWLLAHCLDGVTWGRIEGRAVTLSCKAHPKFPTPRPSLENLMQLRIFGARGELLFWCQERRGAQAEFGARSLCDEEVPAGDVGRPIEDCHLLNGRPVEGAGEGFTLLLDQGRRAQVAPVVAPPTGAEEGQFGLFLKHFIEVDEDSGCARIAASRLSGVRILDPGERVVRTEGA